MIVGDWWLRFQKAPFMIATISLILTRNTGYHDSILEEAG